MRCPAAAAGLAALVWLAGVAPIGAREDEAGSRLEALQRAIAESRARAAAYERQERGLLEVLEAVDAAAREVEAALRSAREEAGGARAALESLQERARRLSERRASTQRRMAARAVALYRAGEVGPARAIFAGEGVRDVVARVDALRRLVAQDRALLARYRAETAALEETRVASVAAAGREEEALAVLRERSRDLEAERGAKRALLDRVGGDRARERAALAELEAAARALDSTFESLGEAPQPLPEDIPRFASLRGRLPAPVDAPIARGFGKTVDAEFRTSVFRKGVDFAADYGAPVRAVASGLVRHAGWFGGYGNLVILDHGDDHFSVSGHLGEIAVRPGDRVAAGQVLGTVGDTGSLAGPLLYFEVRRGREPLDPGDWLAPSTAR
jgi:septal ring factor EnvC (AmiA/AmiB activator)